MKGREFDFSRLLLLIGSGLGIWAFFKPFYQVETFYARPSAFNIGKQLYQYFEHQPIEGLSNELLTHQLAQNPTYFIPVFILLFIPLIFGIIAIELLIRSLWLRLNIVHRGWAFLGLSFVGITASWWLGQQQTDFEFHFFESVKGGYWQSLTMVIFSLFAKFSEWNKRSYFQKRFNNFLFAPQKPSFTQFNYLQNIIFNKFGSNYERSGTPKILH